MAARGQTLELHYIDGRPDGMITAELFNWTGHVLSVSRTQLKEALKREETRATGVYLLIGEKDGEPYAYVGQSDEVGKRVANHDSKKDWWDKVIFMTSTGNRLNKAHVSYLEAWLYQEAKRIGRSKFDNDQIPKFPSLSEADVAKMETFAANLLTVLPAVRVDMFVERVRHTEATATSVKEGKASGVLFGMEIKGLRARALLRNGELVVLKGSDARSHWIGKNYADSSYGRLYHELREEGVIVVENGNATFAKDYAFKSPSAAASVVSGRSSAGTWAWIHEASGARYCDWEASQEDNV